MLIKNLDKAFELSLSLFMPPLAGLIIGKTLDESFYTTYFTPFLLFLGIISGIWSFLKIIRNINKNLIK